MGVGDGVAEHMVKELLGGKDLGSSNDRPYNGQEAICALLLTLGAQKTCIAQALSQ